MNTHSAKEIGACIRASAAGKVILCGEYAVLHEWPALVFAVDKHFSVSLERIQNSKCGLQVDVVGLKAQSQFFVLNQQGDIGAEHDSPLSMFAQVFNALLRFYEAHDYFQNQAWCITLDSSALFDTGDKLGLGSSAAMTVALDRALHTVVNFSISETVSQRWRRLHRIHSEVQGKVGSGVDIAASLAGGFNAFLNRAHESCELTQVVLPKALSMAFIWSGESASTPLYLQSLSDWKRRHPQLFEHHMSALGQASSRLVNACEQNSSAPTFIALLGEFTETLKAFDQVSKLGIFSDNHRLLFDKASSMPSLVYKPCGAGGGDLGLAMSLSKEAMNTFVLGLELKGMRVVAMNIDEDNLNKS